MCVFKQLKSLFSVLIGVLAYMLAGNLYSAPFIYKHAQHSSGSGCYYSNYDLGDTSNVSVTVRPDLDPLQIAASGAQCRSNEVIAGARLKVSTSSNAFGLQVCTEYVAFRSCLAQSITWWVRWGAEYEYTTKTSTGPNDAPECLAYGECYKDLCGSVGGEISNGEDTGKRVSYSSCIYVPEDRVIMKLEPYCCPLK